MAWIWDVPTGVYKNHALSSKVRREAMEDAVFMGFVRDEPGYGKKKGESVTITRVLQLPLAGRVSEHEPLPDGRPTIQTTSITVSEWGYKIPTTRFEQMLAHHDIDGAMRMDLRDQLSLTMDVMVADAFKTTPIKYTPQLAGAGTFEAVTAGDPTTNTADRNLSVQDIREIGDYLAGTLKCPAFRGGRYVGILSTRAARGIKDDPDYKEWLAPTTSTPFTSTRLKDVDRVSLFETNHYDALSNGLGTGSVCGEAVFFGADAVALAVAEQPELRAGVPYDLGRFRDVGWVGVLEAGLVWETSGLARAVHVTSV